MTEKDKALLHVAVLLRMIEQCEGVIAEVADRLERGMISTSARDKFIREANVQRDALLFAVRELQDKYGKPPSVIEVTPGKSTGARADDLPDVGG